MIDHTRKRGAAKPEPTGPTLDRYPKSRKTSAFLTTMQEKPTAALADAAVEIHALVADRLAKLDGKLSDLRVGSVAAMLAEKNPTVRTDLEQADARLVAAQNTVRDLLARFLDLGRVVTAAVVDAGPMTVRAIDAGYTDLSE